MNTENDLYQELVLEHKRTPRNFGHLPHPTHQAQGTNPQCGDQVAVELQVQDGRVQDIRFSGQGCAICMASSSMMTEAVKGRNLASAQQLQQHFRAVLTARRSPMTPRWASWSAWRACAATPAASNAPCWAGTH